MDASNSPLLRPASPLSSVSPSMAIGACPPLDNSTSPSIASSRSVSSSSTQSDSSSAGQRKNGYMRPQGTHFSRSAKNRDSVMCLGSIAHMQYYFARTGLLEGKGAQMARPRKSVMSMIDGIDAGLNIYTPEDDLVKSPQDTDFHEPVMLPPTVSTYAYKEPDAPPPPETPELRRQLRQALEDSRKALEETKEGVTQTESTRQAIVDSVQAAPLDFEEPPSPRGWHEIMGLHLLDIITLAIRAAKTYYTTHPHPQNLYVIQPERKIRSDLYQVLDILKRMAAREFRGGVKAEERDGIMSWINGIDDLVNQEQAEEQEERALRAASAWRHGDWTGREREREWLFMSSFNTNSESLPEWTETTSDEPSTFLKSLQSGLVLVQLHNEMVRRSERPFGEIKTFYTDLAKPYRCAENLRFWAKAAELRWEIKLSLDVLDIVNGKDEETWKQFEKNVLKWSAGVREEISKEWDDAESVNV